MTQLVVGDSGVAGAAYCRHRAAAHGALSPTRTSESGVQRWLTHVRRTPSHLWLSPTEDPWVPSASPDRRDAVTGMAQHLLHAGVGVTLDTRADVRTARGLVALARQYRQQLAVRVGVFTLDPELAARWEPGLASPHARLRFAGELHAAGALVTVQLGPIIPFVNDDEAGLSRLIHATARAGVRVIAPQWIADGPGLVAQVRREVSRGAGAMLGGWFGQAGARHSDHRGLAPHVREVRRERVVRLADRFDLSLAICDCERRGHHGACPRKPSKVRQVQLSLAIAS